MYFKINLTSGVLRSRYIGLHTYTHVYGTTKNHTCIRLAAFQHTQKYIHAHIHTHNYLENVNTYWSLELETKMLSALTAMLVMAF